MAVLIDGKVISTKIKEELKQEVTEMKAQGITPCLAVILVGDDSASAIYVRNKKRACEYVGIESRSYELPEDTTQEELEKLVTSLNEDENVDGILVQLPLPGQIDEEKITTMISPKKDVDGFLADSIGALCLGTEGFRSCTPAGGEAFLRQAPIGQLTAVIAVAKKMGAQIIPTPKGLLVKRAGRLVSPLLLETDVYPGYPTDLQSPMLTALCCAEGNCMVSERVFNGRFGVHEQLNRMGAAIVAGQTSAEVTGGRKLHGERVFAKELRGGAALVLAGLCAEHKTVVENCHFIRRGYEDIVRDFRELGADIGTETEI